MSSAFRSLKSFNYRVWAAGALVSNVGSWMLRTAQDWLVLTQLTHNNASTVGVVIALQFGPQVLFLPLTGYAADHFDRRRFLIVTQTAMGLVALWLGLLVLGGAVTLSQVYLGAFAMGCIGAFDAPVRQTFVSELVEEADLSNAIALYSTAFNVARMIGPMLAGFMIAGVGIGWVFVVDAMTFIPLVGSLCLLRVKDLERPAHAAGSHEGLVDGLKYVWNRPAIFAILGMVLLIGTFGLNFPIFISSMSVQVFRMGAAQYGVLTAMMAVGSIGGALVAAKATAHFVLLVFAAAVFGFGLAIAGLAPTFWTFSIALILVGAASQTFGTFTDSLAQLFARPAMRGRVNAILLAVELGSAPIGAPIVGWIADSFGPRFALGVGAASGLAGAGVGLFYLIKYRDLHLEMHDGHLRVRLHQSRYC